MRIFEPLITKDDVVRKFSDSLSRNMDVYIHAFITEPDNHYEYIKQVTNHNEIFFYSSSSRLHNPFGPAIIRLGNNSDEIFLSWYLNGEPFSFNEYVKEAEWPKEEIVMWKLAMKPKNFLTAS